MIIEMTKYLLCALIVCLPCPAQARLKVKYGHVALQGIIVEQVKYGPPNFENDGICKKVTIRCIKLDKPIDVDGNKEDRFNFDDVKGIRLIQVIEPVGESVKFAIKKRVKIKGKLQEALVGGNYTRAVLTIEKVSDVILEQ